MRNLVLLVGLLLASPASADPPPAPDSPFVLEQGDVIALKEIVETTIPPRYSGALIRWIQGILAREQAKASAEKK